jgi:hypothetical protein
VIEDRRGIGAIRRLGLGGGIALTAAILLFVLMFRQWYGVGFTREPNDQGYLNLFPHNHDAWHGLSGTPILLTVAIAVAVGAAILQLVGPEWEPAIPVGAAVCAAGFLAAAVILIRIAFPPDLSGELQGWAWAATLKFAIFLALAAALAIAFGGWRTWRKSST